MYGEKYLRSLQIYDDRFNENDYIFLKQFEDNVELLKKIFDAIDGVLLHMKLDFGIRFLVFCDFLFSMTSYGLSDPSEILFKINRNEYINKIKLRAIINEAFNCDYHKYIIIHKKLLIALRLENIVKRTQIRKQNKKY